MQRRDAIRSMLAAAMAAARPRGLPSTPRREDPEAQLSRLAIALSPARAHVIASDSNNSPNTVLDPVLTTLRSSGLRLAFPRPGVLPRHANVVVLTRNKVESPRRLELELPELDQWARRSNTTVLVPWRMPDERHSIWVPRLAAASSWFIHIRDIEFEEPAHDVPTFYRTLIDVFEAGKPLDQLSIRTKI